MLGFVVAVSLLDEQAVKDSIDKAMTPMIVIFFMSYSLSIFIIY
ncbi:hypothetical protein LLNZ_03185 [Lactococcus cremoris subsp. cremoris NZ9000]|nr:hypothetical protein LLNZ_03185 [Lactococcus cremoris subsp. cremoris NZ9000]